MAWFGKRTPKSPPEGRTRWMTSTVQRFFVERGIETTIAVGDDDEDVTLHAPDGRRYPLLGLLSTTRGLSTVEAEDAARAHVGSLVEDAGFDDVNLLSADELRQRIRTRLISNRDLRPDELQFNYARPFAEGLVVALCIDLPQTVQTLGDTALANLALDIDELYAHGQQNTDLEPVEVREIIPGGVELIEGASLFTASKAINLDVVMDVPPTGVVFAVPHRHMLLAVALRGPNSLAAVQQLVGLVEKVLGDPAPGGLLSTELFFTRGGRVSRITETGATGTRVIVADDFHQALEEIVAG